jgi:mannosyl-3-phosphoglycerate phosphatase
MQTKHLLIFTDLDGTLLNQQDYDYKPALPILKRLQENQIPIIPVTSKTRQEVESLRSELGLTDPFITENGSAIFIDGDDTRFAIPDCPQQHGYYRQQFGITYAEARQKLLALAQAVGENLRGFGDLTETEIEQLTGLSSEEIKRAKAREFTEPFITPHQGSSSEIEFANRSWRSLLSFNWC